VWLASIGLAAYVENFRKSKVNGQTLAHLSEAQVRSVLKVKKALHLQALLRGVAALQELEQLRARLKSSSPVPPDQVARIKAKIAVYKWSTADVGEFLEAHEIYSLTQLFDRNGIHGAHLLALTPEDLSEVLAIDSPLLVLKVSLLIKELLAETNASAQSRSPASRPPFLNWNCDKVGTWLERIGLSRYKDRFSSESIDGLCLAHLSTEVMELVGVRNVLHQRSLQTGLEQLRREWDTMVARAEAAETATGAARLAETAARILTPRRANRRGLTSIDYVRTWSAEKVGRWLSKNDFDDRRNNFTTNGVHGALLLELSREDMARHLGMDNSIERDRLHRDVQGLAGADAAEVAAITSPRRQNTLGGIAVQEHEYGSFLSNPRFQPASRPFNRSWSRDDDDDDAVPPAGDERDDDDDHDDDDHDDGHGVELDEDRAGSARPDPLNTVDDGQVVDFETNSSNKSSPIVINAVASRADTQDDFDKLMQSQQQDNERHEGANDDASVVDGAWSDTENVPPPSSLLEVPRAGGSRRRSSVSPARRRLVRKRREQSLRDMVRNSMGGDAAGRTGRTMRRARDANDDDDDDSDAPPPPPPEDEDEDDDDDEEVVGVAPLSDVDDDGAGSDMSVTTTTKGRSGPGTRARVSRRSSSSSNSSVKRRRAAGQAAGTHSPKRQASDRTLPSAQYSRLSLINSAVYDQAPPPSHLTGVTTDTPPTSPVARLTAAARRPFGQSPTNTDGGDDASGSEYMSIHELCSRIDKPSAARESIFPREFAPCAVCEEVPANCLFERCGHQDVCMECVGLLESCPTCFEDVKSVREVAPKRAR